MLCSVWESGQRTIVSHFPLRSWLAIRARAIVLGLPFGTPQGFETITKASDRAGFSKGYLRKILEFSGVQVYKSMTTKRHGKARTHIVCVDEVDAAVKRFMRFTTIADWIRSTGCQMSRQTVHARIAEAGILPAGKIGDRIAVYRHEDLDRLDMSNRHQGRRKYRSPLANVAAIRAQVPARTSKAA